MFQDREEAGRLLAEKLSKCKNDKDTIVLGIPRGGIVVAYYVAKELNVKMDVLVVRKIGFPGNEEFAIGAASQDSFFVNEEVSRELSEEFLSEQIKAKQDEAMEKTKLLRGTKPIHDLKGKNVIIVDDGIATGATISMAISIIRKSGPKKIIAAIPVAPPESVKELEKIADEVVCLLTPKYFAAVGQFYRDFRQVSDEEAVRFLADNSKDF